MKRKQFGILGWILSFAFVCMAGCGNDGRSAASTEGEESVSVSASAEPAEQAGPEPMESAERETENNSEEEANAMKMNVRVGDKNFTATLENNAAAETFTEMMKSEPVVIQMSDYAGFEKVGSLGTELPASNSQTTTRPGDIVLYNGNQIVIFYGSNSWSYTRLGKIDDLTGWEEALGSGDVTVTFSVE